MGPSDSATSHSRRTALLWSTRSASGTPQSNPHGSFCWERGLARGSPCRSAFAFVVAGLIAPDLLKRAAEAGLSGPYRAENLRAIRLGGPKETEIRGGSFVTASGGQS
jgi:hypothetical protein